LVPLPAPTPGAVLGSWSWQPSIAFAVAAAGWYLVRARPSPGQPPWPRRRTASFAGGIVLLLVVTCGPAQSYARTLYWVWVAQGLALLLIVPLPLLAGQPVALAARAGGPAVLPRLVESRIGRALASPIVGPALVPLACLLCLYGAVPGWGAESAGVDWLVEAFMLALGAAVVLPLVSVTSVISSLAAGTALAVGLLELLLDAVPGLVMRLSTHPVSTYFAHRTPPAWGPSWLHDQQLGGGLLWAVAELVDIPFLVLAFRLWLRADAREAAALDASFDAAVHGSTSVPGPSGAAGGRDEPWFLSDPRLHDRFRRRG
jgi:cytochrome c oxidase assembly factor CtaG